MHRRFLVLIALMVLLVPAAAHASPGGATEAEPDSIYIVQLRGASLAAYKGELPGLPATNPRVLGQRKLDVASPASQAYLAYLGAQHRQFLETVEQRLGRPVEMLREYNHVLNGVALVLTPAEAAVVATLPQVRHVQENVLRQLLTDHGPSWIGAPSLWGGSTSCAPGGICGEGVIVGVIDTGINTDHLSFADVGADGYNHTNPFGADNYVGRCASQPSLCNDKLIGAWDYFPSSTPEDAEGHGSHTASTAAGNFLYDVTLNAPTTSFVLDIGGVAPHANVIAYRACNELGCLLFNLVDAIDQAVADGVDVINYSIGGSPSDPWTDSDAQAFLDAREAGVFVATSAGNSGPGPATLGSPGDAPWLLTVGASTHNRAFLNAIADMNTDQATMLPDIQGRSITSSYGPAPIVYAGDPSYNNPLCLAGEFDAAFAGQIVICDRGESARVDKSASVADNGGGGMVLANDAASGYGLNGDAHSVPSVHITYADGVILKNWLNNGDTGHVGRIVGTTMAVGDSYGDAMASFSSRGPNPSTNRVIKPDITGPGVDIVAAVQTPGNPYPAPEIDSYSGTSMSSPHLAGAAALLVQAQPGWTPAELQSALMSTAKSANQYKDDGTTSADPFDLGAGRVDLTVAASAGFVLDITRAQYEAADPGSGGDPSALNLPSLAHEACNNSCSWTRTLESTRAGEWNVSFATPPGMSLTASPSTFSFSGAGQAQAVTFTANVYGLASGQWRFAQVRLEEAGVQSPDAHFPVAVSTTCAVPSAPTVAVQDVDNSDVQLSWSSTGGSSYEVWRSSTPYFTPGQEGAIRLTSPGFGGTAYTDNGVIGPGQPDYFYKVVARNSCGGASSDLANQAGMLQYSIVPASP